MLIIRFVVLVAAVTACSTKQTIVYDPFAQVETIDKETTNTTERTEYLSFRYYHDMLEPSHLNYLKGVKESYRFTFSGDCEPDLIIRINHWAWSDMYSISIKKRERNSYHSAKCIRNPEVDDFYSCPPTKLVTAQSIEISPKEWKSFKSLINSSKFWSENPRLHPKSKFAILHGTHWQIEAYRDTVNNVTHKDYAFNTPWQGTNIYNIGEYLLMLAKEPNWLRRTRDIKQQDI